MGEIGVRPPGVAVEMWEIRVGMQEIGGGNVVFERQKQQEMCAFIKI